MAVRIPTVDLLQSAIPVKLVTWTGLLNADSGSPVELVDYSDMTVTIEGTFSVGGTGIMEGSNDGTNYYPLTDPQGNAISKTAGGIEAIIETPRYVRPRITAGDGSTVMQVRILARRAAR